MVEEKILSEAINSLKNIPVPPDLKQRILAAEHRTGMVPWMLKPALAFALILAAFIPFLPNPSAKPVQANIESALVYEIDDDVNLFAAYAGDAEDIFEIGEI